MRNLCATTAIAGAIALAAGPITATPALADSQTGMERYGEPVGTLRFVTGPAGGTYYPLGEGLVQILNQNAEGARASATPTGGSTENARLIALDEADFGWAAGDVVYYAYNGGREFDEALENLRVVTAGHASAGHMAVRADSDIQSVQDLVGKSIGVGAAGSSNAQAAEEWLTTLGVDPAEVDMRYISTSATVDALRDGAIDAGFQLAGVPASTWMELTADHPIRLLGISEDDMATLNERLPFYEGLTIPAGTYTGLDEDLLTIGVNVMLITREDTAPVQSWELLRMMFDFNERFQDAHPNGADWNPDNVVKARAIPFHQGAIDYFEANGIDY